MRWSRPRFNILNVNTGSDANLLPSSLKRIFVISSGSNSHTHTLCSCSLPLTPSSSKYQKHRTSFKSTREECMWGGRGERGSLGPLKLGWRLGFFGWEGEEGSPCGLLYVEYVWIRVNELMDSWNTHKMYSTYTQAFIHVKKQKNKNANIPSD